MAGGGASFRVRGFHERKPLNAFDWRPVMQIAVCSWSYRLSAERVAEEMSKCEVKNVHLALNPFVDPLAVVPGTAGETENVAGTGGVDSLDDNHSSSQETYKRTKKHMTPL